jgi:DnaA-homolog protein
MQQLPLGVRLRDRATFESFLPGANAAALGELQAVAAGHLTGLIWLCGSPASGKSHLLQAVCAASAVTHTAAYLPLRQLHSMGAESLVGWQSTQCLCLDDLDAVIGDMEWERALFALYRDAEERGAMLLMSAILPPQHLSFVLPDLASRCAAGAILTLTPLGEDQQREALQLRARLRGLELPEETALYLQRRMPRDMETLYGLLDTLDAAALQAQRRLTVPFIRAVLAERPV